MSKKKLTYKLIEFLFLNIKIENEFKEAKQRNAIIQVKS